jgi:hypothetical protein
MRNRRAYAEETSLSFRRGTEGEVSKGMPPQPSNNP